jgi:hypothetical protein
MGRPATGRSSKMIRVSNDLDPCTMRWLYYDVMPAIQILAESAVSHSPTEPRWEKIHKLLRELDWSNQCPIE